MAINFSQPFIPDTGGTLVYITLTDDAQATPFDNSISISIGKNVWATIPCLTTYINQYTVSFISPAISSGEAIVLIKDILHASVSTAIPVMFTNNDNYKIKINGQDVTSSQIKRFLQKKELSIISQYGLVSNNVAISAPFDIKPLLYKNSNNDIISVYEGNALIYSGYITDKVKNFSRQVYEISVSPLFNLLSKKEITLSDTLFSPPIARLVSLINQYMPSNYILQNISSLDAVLFPNCTIALNSGTNTTNVLNMIIALCELLNIGIFIDDNFTIRLVPVPVDFSPGKNIKLDGVLIESPTIKENKTFFYDTVGVTYTATVGGSAADLANIGAGNLIKKVSCSNTCFNAITAGVIANRTLSIYSHLYVTSQFKIVKTFDLNIGDFFYYENYWFLCTYKEETLQSYIINAIGIDSEGL